MEPELRVMLDRILRTTEQNHRVLKNMHRHAVIGRYIRAFLFLPVFGLTLASYYYVQPYLTNIGSAWDTINQFRGSINILPR